MEKIETNGIVGLDLLRGHEGPLLGVGHDGEALCTVN